MSFYLYELRDLLIQCNVVVLITGQTYRIYMVTVLKIGIVVTYEHMNLVVSQRFKENLFGYAKRLKIAVLTAIKHIAQMKHRCNAFPSKYWEKSVLVELSLEGRKLKIIILASEMGICYYGYFQYLVVMVKGVLV